jgi:hypothetical protein
MPNTRNTGRNSGLYPAGRAPPAKTRVSDGCIAALGWVEGMESSIRTRRGNGQADTPDMWLRYDGRMRRSAGHDPVSGHDLPRFTHPLADRCRPCPYQQAVGPGERSQVDNRIETNGAPCSVPSASDTPVQPLACSLGRAAVRHESVPARVTTQSRQASSSTRFARRCMRQICDIRATLLQILRRILSP